MRLATVLLLLLAAPALAQTPGDCELGSAEVDLDISDVNARLFNTGSLFFGNTTVNGDGYLVPLMGPNPPSPIFAAGIWIGGTVGGDLRVAGSTYDDFEFWPGPLGEDGTLPNPDDCSAFDRFWVVDAYDLAYYGATGDATGDLLNWPFDLGAPVIDGDGVEGNYDLAAGDRPAVYGHQTAFWVMNDVGNVHENNLTEPIGLEVRVTAFSTIEAALDQQTFYRYELVNRNSQPFEAARFGLFVDPDLGDATDDYIGSDSTRNMAFVYNGAEEDAVYGTPPAAGYDFLTGADVSMFFVSVGGGDPTSDPVGGVDYYNFLRGLWRDGTPLTEGGTGYMTDGPVLTWTYPGDPVTGQFWSEVNADMGHSNPPGDRRNLLASEAFTLAPGESRTFDLAILFAQGDDRFDSIVELRNLSDAAQARYDAGDLFAPSPLQFPPAGTLATPEVLSPDDGEFIVVGEPTLLEWTEVPGADRYSLQFASTPDFADAQSRSVVGTSTYPDAPEANELTTVYWRVQAVAGIEQSLFSAARSYSIYRYEPEYFGENGERIVETENPNVEDVCADAPDDPGCSDELAPGNTVWLDANATDDYVLTNPENDFGDLFRTIGAVGSDDFEIRFSEACSEPGACLGIYASALPDGSDLIASVPFEVWNTRVGLGDGDDEGDDVRMIPLLRALDDTEPSDQWADAFPAEQDVIVGEDTLVLGVTQRVIGVMPDRPNGYALFADAANSFGGPGAIYVPEEDGDDQVDPIPGDESRDCRRQNYYVDFCYRGASNLFVGVIGGIEGLVLADLTGDGTTPPVGTTIRFVSNDPLFVDAEDDAPSTQPQALALDAAYPNPFATSATVGYQLAQPADVWLAVYDVLGRRVAVLAEGPTAGGAHHATFDGAGLASGVYLVVLEADGQRQSQKVLLLR